MKIGIFLFLIHSILSLRGTKQSHNFIYLQSNLYLMFLSGDVGVLMSVVFVISIVLMSAIILMIYPLIKERNVLLKFLIGIIIFIVISVLLVRNFYFLTTIF
jgi:hypothetical protein